MTVTTATALTLTKAGIRDEHAFIIAKAFLSSIWITACGLAAGALVQSYFDGVHDVSGLISWAKDGHAWGFVVTQVVVPFVRARFTWIDLKKN